MKPGASDQIEFPNHSGFGVKEEEHDECKRFVGAFYAEGRIIAQPGGDGPNDT
jgi:hypothetical protein